MKHISKRPIIIATIAVSVFAFLWLYVNDTLQKSRASQDQVAISFSPNSGTYAVNQQHSTDVLIQAADTKKISGVDITLSTTGGAQIVDVANPVPLSSSDATFFTEITKTVTPQSARIASVAQKPDTELPQAVKVHVTYVGSSIGGGQILVNQASTQMVGNTTGGTFGLSTVGEFSGSFSGPTPTITSITPTAAPNCGTNGQGACQTSSDCSACTLGGRANGINGGVESWQCISNRCVEESQITPTQIPVATIVVPSTAPTPTQTPIATLVVPTTASTVAPTQPPIATIVVPTQYACPTAPICKNGTLMHGDPGPGEPSCPHWICILTSVTPPISPTVTPRVCQKAKGDANCDFSIDVFDFEIWRKEFTQELTTHNADFNSDTHTDVLDFEIWRSNYFDQNI